jgi:D-amino peptidase
MWAVPVALLLVLLTGGADGPGADGTAQTGPKIYISADMEGLTGAVTAEQLGPSGFEYGAYRRIMTEEVLAAIEGARAAGAGEIVVSDSHGNGQNLLLDMLPDDVRVIRSWPRPLMMMEGIDGSFDGAIFIGYHAGTTNPAGVRAHTMSSANLTDIRLNGRSHPESGINAAIAGHFGVPVIMITGDDAIASETRAIIGEVETAVVKRAISYHAADTLTPAAGRELIREAAYRAVRDIDRFRPYRIEGPVEVTVRFKNYRPPQMLAYLPMFEPVDAHAVRYRVEDMAVASRVLEFITNYEIGLAP